MGHGPFELYRNSTLVCCMAEYLHNRAYHLADTQHPPEFATPNSKAEMYEDEQRMKKQ